MAPNGREKAPRLHLRPPLVNCPTCPSGKSDHLPDLAVWQVRLDHGLIMGYNRAVYLICQLEVRWPASVYGLFMAVFWRSTGLSGIQRPEYANAILFGLHSEPEASRTWEIQDTIAPLLIHRIRWRSASHNPLTAANAVSDIRGEEAPS